MEAIFSIISGMEMIKLAFGPDKCILHQLLGALDLFNKVKGANSRITLDAAKDRW